MQGGYKHNMLTTVHCHQHLIESYQTCTI